MNLNGFEGFVVAYARYCPEFAWTDRGKTSENLKI
jgi:hypothetical protein